MLKLDEVKDSNMIELSLTQEVAELAIVQAIEVTLDCNEQAFRGYELDEFLINLRPLLNQRNNNEFKSSLGPELQQIFER
jgi:hypothetical protein